MIVSTEEFNAVRAAVAACFAANAQPLTIRQAKTWIAAKYGDQKFDPKVVHGQIRAACINKNYTRVERRDAPKILFYDEATQTYRTRRDDDASETSDGDAEESEAEPASDEGTALTFALERQLRDFLVNNLGAVERGLQLWSLTPPSVEFCLTSDGSPASIRRVDILAKDVSGMPVVLELKLNRAHDKVIGQALLYRSKLKKQLNVSRVRIILIAIEISDELRLACEEIADVSLFEYQVSMKLNRIGQADTQTA